MSAKIAQALHQVMSSVGYIQKTGKNAFHGYKYAGEADLLEKLRPAMLEAGLILIPSIESVSPIDEHGITTVRMEYMLVHKDGDIWPHRIGAAGQGGDKNKNGVGDKGLYKAITGANKYLLFKLFQIETGDDPEASEAFVPKAEPKPEKAVPMLERNAFMVECREAIAQFEDAEVLGTWWNSDAQKKARREYQLDSTQVQTLKTAVIDRRAVLTRKAA
jgi:hypothetical protein